MARGGPRKADGPSRKKVTQTVLVNREDAEIPPLPDPHDYLPLPPGADEAEDDDFYDPEFDWAEPVKRWWEDIWTSPMSSEFVNSDIHGLYIACVYLHESLNPYYKLTDRLKAGSAWEATIKNYGLTPTARESLRWAVSQGEQAQNRTNQLRSQASNNPQASKQSRNEIADLYRQHG